MGTTSIRQSIETLPRALLVFSAGVIKTQPLSRLMTRVDILLLGHVGRSVSLRAIPPGYDPFEYALAHAVEGIRRYRVNPQKFFKVEKWEGEEE